VELGYADLGEITASGPGGNASAEANAWDLVGVGILPLGNNFSLYGKAGFYRGEVDGQVNTPGFAGGASENNTDLTFGVGARYDVTRNVAVRAEWQRYSDMGGGNVGESDVDVMSLGLQYQF
jgi:OOP family OmpA-OmpF porin